MTMKFFMPLALGVLMLCSSAKGDLIMTGVFDGPLTGGIPKFAEFYSVGTTNLSQYGVGSANNGGGTDGVEQILSGTAMDGQFVYVAQTLVAFNAYFVGQIPVGAILIEAANGSVNVNGDDAIELFNDPTGLFVGGQTVFDVFGDINVSGTGQPWEYLDGWAYRNDGTGPDGSTFVLGNWTYSGINVNDGTTTNTGLVPFPIGTFVPPVVIPEPSAFALTVILGGAVLLRRRT